MANKIKYNLKNVHIAKLTVSESNGATTYTYGTPQAIPGAVSLSLDAEGENSPFYADGIVYYRAITNNGYSGDLELALVTNVEPVRFALLFEFDGDASAIRHVLYYCAVSARPTLSSQTKEATIEPQTETLTISADPRPDGVIKARTGDATTAATYAAWYSAVYE